MHFPQTHEKNNMRVEIMDDNTRCVLVMLVAFCRSAIARAKLNLQRLRGPLRRRVGDRVDGLFAWLLTTTTKTSMKATQLFGARVQAFPLKMRS